jgi:hypothetical protein
VQTANSKPTLLVPTDRSHHDTHAVCSLSQELVNPPDNPPFSAWVQHFPDGQPVETATGFGTLNSSQIAFSSRPQNYIAQGHAALAGLMLAGLAPRLQFGEILWWFSE